jgi:ATP-binding cassette subfamily B protein
MQTVIGENGAMTSGGEGQRVRLARAKMRPTARLVVLDEAFRGLDRAARRRLLQRARTAWPQATLLCVTHDVGETLGFERVLVLEDGVIAEDGDPKFLVEKQDSLFRVLHEAEQNVDRELWGTPKWQRWFVRRGRLETAANDETQSGLQGVPHGVP